MKRILIGLLSVGLLLVTVAACRPSEPAAVGVAASGTGPDAATLPEMPVGRLGGDVVPTRYTLDLVIVPESERFSGRVEIGIDIREPSTRIWLHGKRLDVAEAWLEQGDVRIDAAYEQVEDTGIVRVDLVGMPEPGTATLVFDYHAPFDQALEGLYKVVEDDRAYAFTQFEATSARLAFPGFDEPRFKTPFEIHVTARADERVITTMPEVAREAAGPDLIRRSYAVTPPLPTYLIAFAVGPLDVVEWGPVPANGVRDWPLRLRGVAAAGKGGQLEFALENTARVVAPLEHYFDRAIPYPKLDIIAVPDFAAGAMENVGAITYREQLLLLDESDSIARKRAYAGVHAHELAHQWFGNLVTPKWWDDIWLNESFATWMAAKAAAEAFPDWGFEDQMLGRAIGVMNADALASARQVRNPVESNHDIANAFDGITYAKGGAVLTMFEAWLGEEAFREGVRLHMRRFEHGVADYADFLQSLAEGSGRSEVVEAFSSFLFQPGVPLIETALQCDDEVAAVRVEQSRYLPLGSTAERDRHWRLPVCLRYGGADANGRVCELVETPAARIELPTTTCPDWVMPNAGGSGYYRFTLADDGWQRLVAHLDALDEAESRMLLGSMSAAYRSGDLGTAGLLEAAGMLADNADREVATAALGEIGFMHDRLARTEAARAGIAALLRELYGERLDTLGIAVRPEDSTDDQLLRATLAGVLADEGRDTEWIDTLNGLADEYLDDLAIDATTLDPGLVGTLLATAVRERDQEFARALFERALESTDATFRGRALGALGQAEDPATGEMLRAHVGDARLRDNEAIAIVFGQVGNEHQRQAMWDWARDETNLETLLSRVPTWRQGAVVMVGRGFCSESRAGEVEAFFADRVADLEGGPRALAQTLERIRLCAAQKDRYADEVTTMFSAGAAGPARE